MKYIQKTGLYLFITGILIFTLNIFLGSFSFEESKVKAHFDKTQIVDKGDTIAKGFIAAVKDYSSHNSISTSNLVSFNSALPQIINLHNKTISKELIVKEGITEQEVEELLTSIQSSGSINYSSEVLTNVFGDLENKKKLLEDNTSWMFTASKTYENIENLKNDLTNKINEINSKVGQEYHIKSDGGTLLNINKSLINSGAKSNTLLWLFLTFGIVIIGSVAYNLPDIKLLGVPGIKHNGIFHSNITNRGWLAWLVLVYLVGFYLLLYFWPQYLANNIILVDPVSQLLSGNPAGHWFLYGFIYCVAMTLMAIRMFIKYRHNNYQMVRTAVVLFFQIIFAFLVPEILVRFDQPWYDFKNAWPLDYDFFFQYNITDLINNGGLGIFMFVWGIALSFIIIPVLVYFYGKRWYCSWVCGCGGLAETLGDPYRQHSDKSLKAWKFERYIIHGVLVFAIIMTLITLYAFFTGSNTVLGIDSYTVQRTYGFLIGSIFSGVIGTGFYPIFGNRTWCRFGCPLAAYMGLVQRIKSARFRITTNGGQCISCGNCSTYCEQGIDVRAYAQKGEDIIRSSCVGCGVCSAVCPRGVLKLENSEAPKKVADNPIIFENNIAKINF